MDNLSSLLGPILSDPDAMKNLQEAAKQMGLESLLSGEAQANTQGGGHSSADNDNTNTQNPADHSYQNGSDTMPDNSESHSSPFDLNNKQEAGSDNPADQSQNSSKPDLSGFDLSSIASLFNSSNGEGKSSEKASSLFGGIDISTIISMLSLLNGSGGNSGQNGDSAGSSFNPDIVKNISKLAPIMGSMSNNSSIKFLDALRPMLSEERAKKLDGAEKFIALAKVAAILKESKLI